MESQIIHYGLKAGGLVDLQMLYKIVEKVNEKASCLSSSCGEFLYMEEEAGLDFEGN